MKANETPEKIYLDSYGSGFSHGFHTNKLHDNDVEYIRKDSFIKKATSYIQQHWIWNTKMIEDFKKYMEE